MGHCESHGRCRIAKSCKNAFVFCVRSYTYLYACIACAIRMLSRSKSMSSVFWSTPTSALFPRSLFFKLSNVGALFVASFGRGEKCC